MSKRHDIAIVGAGAVGLATAYALIQQNPGLNIAVIDKETSEAQHQTGHNSGVIHSGVYYQPGSLKATNCIRGYGMLLDFAQKHDIPHEICGKLIVATHKDEVGQLEKIYQRGKANGLQNLQILSAEAAREIEPHIRVHSAIQVPQAGIIHYPDLAAKLRQLLTDAGVSWYFSAPVSSCQRDGKRLRIRAGDNDINCAVLVGCAGLYADKLAERCGLDPACKIIPFRGEYYELKPEKNELINHLVYPVPDPNFPFLGVHFTRMIRGGIEAGPNAVLAFRREGYSRWQLDWKELTETISYAGFRSLAAKYWKTGLGELYRSYNKSAFVNALKKLLPEICSTDLVSGGAGVRAQACKPDGQLVDDFLFTEAPGMVHVINAPSPAATSCLAIGTTVAGKTLNQWKNLS